MKIEVEIRKCLQIFFIIEEVKQTVLDFSKGTAKDLFYFKLISI